MAGKLLAVPNGNCTLRGPDIMGPKLRTDVTNGSPLLTIQRYSSFAHPPLLEIVKVAYLAVTR